MKTLTDIKTLTSIAKELKKSAAMYKRAAQSVNEGIVTAEMESIADSREKFMDQIIDEIHKHSKEKFSPDSTLDLQRNVELILGDLLVRQNVPRILKACADSDQKLIDLYSEQLEHKDMRDDVHILLNKQYNDILELQRSMKKRIDKYPWFTG